MSLSRRDALMGGLVTGAATLDDVSCYYNTHRTHAALSGVSPARFSESAKQDVADINDDGWKPHWRDLFQTPMSA